MRTIPRGSLQATRFSFHSPIPVPFLVLLLMAVLEPAWVGTLPAASWEWHVSQEGNDQWSGQFAFPNDRKTDGPFASLERARDALRAARSQGRLQAPAVIYLHAGQYELPQTFTLEKQDSGTAQAPVTFRPWERDEVILSGGRTLRAWTEVSAPEILKRLPMEARSHVWRTNLKQAGLTDWGEAVTVGRRLELFFNKQPMTLARWPNEGFVKIAAVTGGQPFASHGIKGDKVGRFLYEGERPKRWTAEPEIWLHGYWFWDWSDAYQRVKSIDAAARTIELEPPYHGYGYRAGQRYYAVNLLAELDRPGEWYLDRSDGELFFWPPSPIKAAEASVSVLPTLVSMREASWITLRGLIFEAARDNALTIQGGEHDRVGGSVVRNTGGWGMTVRGGRHHSVIGCDIYQTGEGGVALAGGDRATLTPASHEAVNNHIHHFGRIQRTYRPAIGVSGVGQRVAHNLIHDGPHNAIQLSGNDHLLEGNEIHHVCFETGDVGAFYTGRDWTARGTVLRRNYFHDISGPGLYGAMAVYLDDAASGFTIEGNVFERAGRAVFIGGGRDNMVENNVFVDCHPSVHVDARGLGWMKDHVQAGGTLPKRLQAVPYTKPPWSERYPRLLTLLEDDPGAPKGNVIARNISVGGDWSDFEKAAQPLLKLEDNLVTRESPFLKDSNRRFQLPDDAPARKLGFKPIAFEQIGLQQDAWRDALPRSAHPPRPLSRIQVAPDGRHFQSASGQRFVPWGINYYRPGTGWAPQVWKRFDPDATRRDFQRMKKLGVNCVRVFLSFGSFYMTPGRLDTNGLAKFDRFLDLAEEEGLYVHPTGPDHWEGLPAWARGDRVADETVLGALETFWKLFAARYRGRHVIFAYDLRNEPAVAWDTPSLREKWNHWLEKKYKTVTALRTAWPSSASDLTFGNIPPPPAREAPDDPVLLDYQLFRESVADEWTRRQVAAIKSADPEALVTVGLIQWSVPALLPGLRHYSGFRPERQARFLDFMEIHFYPLANGAYEYRNDEDETRNLAYLESVVREAARPGKPLVIAEMGWYGGKARPTFDGGRHPPASEEDQARWCRRLIETTAGLATGWLNWGFYDQPEATDVSQLTGLLTADGKLKAWGREFQKLAGEYQGSDSPQRDLSNRPDLDWNRCLTSLAAGKAFREAYGRAFQVRKH